MRQSRSFSLEPQRHKNEFVWCCFVPDVPKITCLKGSDWFFLLISPIVRAADVQLVASLTSEIREERKLVARALCVAERIFLGPRSPKSAQIPSKDRP